MTIVVGKDVRSGHGSGGHWVEPVALWEGLSVLGG